jgi:CxxC-x17-CxxC domain-containing protein
MIDGLAGRPFSAKTLPPFPASVVSNRETIIKVSRERYATPRNIVEEKISKWAGFDKALVEEIGATSKIKTGGGKSSETTLYDARCSICGKDTKVVFEPDGKRPIYCKSCLKKTKANDKPIKEQKPLTDERAQEKTETSNSSKEEKPVQQSEPLEEVLSRGAVSFGKRPLKRNGNDSHEKKHRKEVDISELKKTLKESLRSLRIEKDNEKE